MATPLNSPSHSFHIRLAERVLWTAVQAGLGVLTVTSLNVPVAYAAVVASVLAVVKGYVARRVGNPQDPATLPWGA